MSHAPFPSFPPTPEIGDTFTPVGTSQVWTYLGPQVGWEKTKIDLSDTAPVWPGRITKATA